MKIQDKAYIFLDQNVMNKMVKKDKGYQSFQDNVDKLFKEKIYKRQLLTPFSLLEFSGCKRKDISEIKYQGKKFTDFSFSSYKDFNNESIAKHLKEQISKKVTKDFLKEQLKNKRDKEAVYLNEEGFRFIESYTEKIDLFHEDLIDYLFLEQLSQINTSNFPKEDRHEYIGLCSKFVLDFACRKHSFGSFRTVLKLYREWKKIKDKSEFFKEQKYVSEILERSDLKLKGDRVDCEIIHLAFFGWENKPCHIYTTDDKDTIKDRLRLYHILVKVIIRYYFEYSAPEINKTLTQTKNKKKRPEWKPGKIFILKKETGEKITKIPVTKIYEGKTNY